MILNLFARWSTLSAAQRFLLHRLAIFAAVVAIGFGVWLTR